MIPLMKKSFQILCYSLLHCCVLLLGSIGIGLLAWWLVLACTASMWAAAAAGVVSSLFTLFVPSVITSVWSDK